MCGGEGGKVSDEPLKFDESALRNGGKLYYDPKSKTIKAEPSYKDKLIADLQSQLLAARKALREITDIRPALVSLKAPDHTRNYEAAYKQIAAIANAFLEEWPE